MLKKNILFYFLTLFISFNQTIYCQSYDDLQKKYEYLEADNKSALPLVKKLIKKAKKEKEFYGHISKNS